LSRMAPDVEHATIQSQGWCAPSTHRIHRGSIRTLLHRVLNEDCNIRLARVLSQHALEMSASTKQDGSHLASRHVEPSEPGTYQVSIVIAHLQLSGAATTYLVPVIVRTIEPRSAAAVRGRTFGEDPCARFGRRGEASEYLMSTSRSLEDSKVVAEQNERIEGFDSLPKMLNRGLPHFMDTA